MGHFEEPGTYTYICMDVWMNVYWNLILQTSWKRDSSHPHVNRRGTLPSFSNMRPPSREPSEPATMKTWPWLGRVWWNTWDETRTTPWQKPGDFMGWKLRFHQISGPQHWGNFMGISSWLNWDQLAIKTILTLLNKHQTFLLFFCRNRFIWYNIWFSPNCTTVQGEAPKWYHKLSSNLVNQ